MVKKKVKEPPRKKKKKHTDELGVLKKMSVSQSEQLSLDSSTSEEGEIWNIGSDELVNINSNDSRQNSESFLI